MEIVKNISVTGSEDRPMATDVFYTRDGKKKPVVIYMHGFNGFKDWGNWDLIARRFAEAGFVFIKFNSSHNGTTLLSPETFTDLEAFGNNNYSRELFDLRAVTDWALQALNPSFHEIDPDKLYLLGHSRGGGVAIIQSAEDKRVKALATWASVAEANTPWGNWDAARLAAWKEAGVVYYPNARTRQEMPLYYQLLEDYRQNQDRLDILRAMGSLAIPVLICHGTSDEAVPVEKARLLKAQLPAAELFLVESDHVFGRKHPWPDNDLPPAAMAVVQKTIRFFQTA